MRTPLATTGEATGRWGGRGRGEKYPPPWRLDYGQDPPPGALGDFQAEDLGNGWVRTWGQRMANGPRAALFFDFPTGKLGWIVYGDFRTEEAGMVGEAGVIEVRKVL